MGKNCSTISKALENMKTSFITTVLNEEKSIKDLLDSLSQQTQKPNQVIIIDAGSTDKTVSIVKRYSKKSFPIKLIIKKDLNRSQARNLAVSQAKHNTIVASDAGCILDENWLKRILQPFENKSINSVAGFYNVQAKTIFQKCVAPFVAVMPDKFDVEKFLPSSRSIAFKKAAWQKAGKYPENLNYCEDLIFAVNLKKNTNMVIKSSAIVYWKQSENLIQFFKQIQNYAAGDIQANYKPHLKKIYSVFLRYLAFYILPPLFIFYLFWPILKHFRYIKHPLAFLYLPVIQIVLDLAIISGVFKSLLVKIKKS